MIKRFFLLFILFQATSCDTLQSVVDSATSVLSNDEIANGLKQALEIGIGEGSQKLSAVDGYFKSPYKILLPEEARKVTDKLKFIPGFSDVENVIVQKLNRAAEDAAQKAKPIFVDAIKGMTFNDVLDILMGADNAATNYLHGSTNTKLYNAFQPIIKASLDEVNATQYWRDAVTAYNKIPLVAKVNPVLDDYVANKALDGLFGMVEVKEKTIRTDVSARSTALLKRVFAKQDNK